jgi:hypothetical protein
MKTSKFSDLQIMAILTQGVSGVQVSAPVTLYLQVLPGLRESIKASMAEPLAESAKGLDW